MAILTKESIVLNQPSVSIEEAIKFVGGLLVKGGYVGERYIEGMLKRDELLTSEIGNFIAIPHGEVDYKDEVKSTGIAVVTYPDGVDWHGSTVHLVIGIAAKGNEHIDIIGNIVDNIESEEDTLKLVKKASAEAIYKVLAEGASVDE